MPIAIKKSRCELERGKRRPHAALRRRRRIAQGGRSRPHLGRHLHRARRRPRPAPAVDREGRAATHRRRRPDHLLHGPLAGAAGHRHRLRRADDGQPHGQVHALAPEARAEGNDRQGLSRAAGEGRAQAVQGRLLRRHRRCGGRALRVREEGGDRGLRGPRHGGDPPARGGWVPGHRALRLPRRRPLSGRAEDLRQGGCMSVQAATRPRPPIAAPHLRTDAWWALPLTTAIVLGGFIVYSTWAAFQNAHYWAPPYLSPFYSPCLSAKCLHVTFGYGLPEVQLPIIGVLSPAFLILSGPGLFPLTCYYHLKAYYRSFCLSPPACAVADVNDGYIGEPP